MRSTIPKTGTLKGQSKRELIMWRLRIALRWVGIGAAVVAAAAWVLVQLGFLGYGVFVEDLVRIVLLVGALAVGGFVVVAGWLRRQTKKVAAKRESKAQEVGGPQGVGGWLWFIVWWLFLLGVLNVFMTSSGVNDLVDALKGSSSRSAVQTGINGYYVLSGMYSVALWSAWSMLRKKRQPWVIWYAVGAIWVAGVGVNLAMSAWLYRFVYVPLMQAQGYGAVSLGDFVVQTIPTLWGPALQALIVSAYFLRSRRVFNTYVAGAR